MSFLSRFFRRPAPTPPAPQLDPVVAERLVQEGKDPGSVSMVAAEPQDIPVKPALEGFKGTVAFEMTLDASGVVKAVALQGAPYAHVEMLEAWAYAWRFRPAQMDGRPHACRMVFEVSW